MSGIIDAIFGFCCFLITEIGLLFGLSYEAINVIVFYVEPIFTGIMVLLAILALCRLPVRIIGTFIFWSVVGMAAIIFAVGAVLVIREGFDYSSSIEQQANTIVPFKITTV